MSRPISLPRMWYQNTTHLIELGRTASGRLDNLGMFVPSAMLSAVLALLESILGHVRSGWLAVFPICRRMLGVCDIIFLCDIRPSYGVCPGPVGIGDGCRASKAKMIMISSAWSIFMCIRWVLFCDTHHEYFPIYVRILPTH